jgi:hypothetical protein
VHDPAPGELDVLVNWLAVEEPGLTAGPVLGLIWWTAHDNARVRALAETARSARHAAGRRSIGS